MDGWLAGWKDRRTGGRQDGLIDGWIDGWTDGWMDERTDGWMDGQTDGRICNIEGPIGQGGPGRGMDSRPSESPGTDRPASTGCRCPPTTGAAARAWLVVANEVFRRASRSGTDHEHGLLWLIQFSVGSAEVVPTTSMACCG